MTWHFYNKEISQRSIGELLEMLEAGTLTSEELVWAYTERIAALDNDPEGPQLHAVRELNPDAFQIARERDWERKTGKCRGPLHGIPILLKDSIDTGDKTRTTCSSAAMRNHRAEEDAFIVKRLREAGAIILGKNYCTEFYGYNALGAPNGYSSLLGGSPRNPFSFRAACENKETQARGPEHGGGPRQDAPGYVWIGKGEEGHIIPGGSSGGSAVSVAADMTAAAIGTETAGSIFEPAYVNGVVGYKPTVGLTSRTGILPIMMCQDAAGPITRTVEDAARIADVIIARDEKDPDTVRAEIFAEGSFLDGLEEASLKGCRLGIVREAYYDGMGGLSDLAEEGNKKSPVAAELTATKPAAPDLTAKNMTAADLTEKALKMLAQAGAEIIEVQDFLPAQILSAPEKHPERMDWEVMNRAFKVRFDEYLARQKDLPFHSLKELLAWNEAHPENIPLGQSYLEKVEALGDLPLQEMTFVKSRMNDLEICGERGVWGAMEKYGLDALILPGLDAQGIAATAGNPTITIPAGFSKQTGPVGITLVGELMGDRELLRIARACEKVLPKRPVAEQCQPGGKIY